MPPSCPFRPRTPTQVKQWDVETGKLALRLPGHEGWVWNLEALDDSHAVLISGGTDSTVRTWDTRAGRQVQRVNICTGERGRCGLWCSRGDICTSGRGCVCGGGGGRKDLGALLGSIQPCLQSAAAAGLRPPPGLRQLHSIPHRTPHPPSPSLILSCVGTCGPASTYSLGTGSQGVTPRGRLPASPPSRWPHHAGTLYPVAGLVLRPPDQRYLVCGVFDGRSAAGCWRPNELINHCCAFVAPLPMPAMRRCTPCRALSGLPQPPVPLLTPLAHPRAPPPPVPAV